MIELEYTSCSCNRTPHSVCWRTTRGIIYAACRAIAICDNDTPGKVKQLHIGHTGRVNAVAWIRMHPRGKEDGFVSVSSDKTAMVWQQKQTSQEFQAVATLKGHTSAVNVVDGITLNSLDGTALRTIIVTGSVDSTVKIWQRKPPEDFTCTQTIHFGTGFCLHAALATLPRSNVPILACGGDDHKIHVFVEQDQQFTKVQTIIGHEDWIRALDFTTDDDEDLLLASGSQDTYIRIHRFSRRDPDQVAMSESSVNELDINQDIKMRENTFFYKHNGVERCFAVTLESVLQGHENWVYSVHWQPQELIDGRWHQPMCLLSSSMDKTMILWAPEPESGIWMEKVRVGEVGGNSLGFYGGVFGSQGNTIMAHGYHGAFQMWTHNQETDSWEAQVTCGGHFDSVEDIAWQSESGDFLLSTSMDQTTRCHGYWKASNQSQSGWYEIARPQIHGYDMQCVAMINKYSFASGADEKVMRIFQAPRNFVENFANISKLDLSADVKSMSLPEGASVPALGLSNKAVYEGELSQVESSKDEVHPNNQYPEVYFTPQLLNRPPDENSLLQNTLWPEVQKLYGHGYEVFSVACHPRGTVLATACKAAKTEHAYIIVWDCSTWRQVCELHSHSLTVTQLSFSHSGKYLLSVSRDRTWSVFKERAPDRPESEPLYSRVAFSDKKTSIHTRIIWACAWSHDDAIFVTVSRDKKALLWNETTTQTTGESCLGGYECCCVALELADAVTAVDVAPCLLPCGSYLLALGLDSGCILLYKWDKSKSKSREAWTKCAQLEQSEAHHMTVKRLQFRPRTGKVGTKGEDNHLLQLASCGADHTVRIYTIDISRLP